MFENKITACDKAYELVQLLNLIDDEDFIDAIIDCVRYNDDYALGELRDGVYNG